MSRTRGVELVSRPQGWPTHDDFRLTETELPDLGPGEVRVRNTYISVDPYMRGRMNDVKSYIPPFGLNEVMTGGAIGEVVESRSEDLAPGDLVVHMLGWRDVAQAPAARFRRVQPVAGVSPSAYLGVLGTTGLTAYVGLLDIAEFKPGDTVFVSGAAGAVGSIVGQIARLKGAARVIGSAGSPEKVRLLTERYGYDAAFDYKEGDVTGQLAKSAPDGIDVYFDNVGGDHLEAAIASFNDFGRAALCGAISQYNATEPTPAPRNLALAIGKQLTLRGFTVGHHLHRTPDFEAEMGGWLSEGRVAHDETVVEGIDNAVEAFLSMMRGGNVGKMLVRVS
ncbi:NADP-dependent oxidoreductase [Marinactinospora endophytica]